MRRPGYFGDLDFARVRKGKELAENTAKDRPAMTGNVLPHFRSPRHAPRSLTCIDRAACG